MVGPTAKTRQVLCKYGGEYLKDLISPTLPGGAQLVSYRQSLDSKTVPLALMAKEFETGKVCHIRALWEHRQCRRVNNKLKQSVEDRRRYAG